MTIEERVTKLELRFEAMKQALLILQKWMDEVNGISDIDQNLFDQLNARVSKLEDGIVCGEVPK